MSKPKKPRTFTTAETELRSIIRTELLRVRAVEWKTGTLETAAEIVLRRVIPWHLAAVRRARGRTVGWCVEPVFQNVKGGWKGGEVHSLLTRLRTPYDGCRVVLVPRRSR